MKTFLLSLFSLFVFNFLNAQIMTTVSGTGSVWGFAGDGGPATTALMYNVDAIAVDAAGNIYMTDFQNGRVRKVDTHGIITTIAGTGINGFSGDGGPATLAQLNNPNGLAVDAAGNIYISDKYNHRIRKINTAGIISTYAGTSPGGYGGDGGQATAALLSQPQGVCIGQGGSIYICDKNNSLIRKVAANGIITTVAGTGGLGYSGDGGPATSALISSPNGVSMDAAGNLYIADNNRIRKVAPNGIITTVAGNGSWGVSGDGGPATSAGFEGPFSVAIDATGNLFIADQYGDRIRKVATNGIITTIAGDGVNIFEGDGGPALLARVNFPSCVALDTAGNLYIADKDNFCVRRINFSARLGSFYPTAASTGTIVTIKGAVFTGTSAVSFGGINATSFTVENDTTITAVVGAGASGNVVVTNGAYPVSLPGFVYCPGISPSISVHATATQIAPGTNVIFTATVTNSGTSPVYQWKKNNLNVGSNSNSYSDATLATGDSVWCIFTSNTSCSNSILVRSNKIYPYVSDAVITTMAGNGTYGSTGDGAAATLAQIGLPNGVAVDSKGNVYISETNHIRKVDLNGNISTIAGTGVVGFSGDGGPATLAQLYYPKGMAIDTAGNIYIADNANHRIRKINPAGIISTVAGNGIATYAGDGGPATAASMNQPFDVKVDLGGNLFIAEYSSGRIRKVAVNGTITTVAGNGQGFSGDNGPAVSALLNNPRAIAVDHAGNLYIADNGNQRVRKVNTAGTITTIAGNGNIGFTGDGGPSTAAELNYPLSVDVDSIGNVYIADAHNYRIRKIDLAGDINTVAGIGTAGFSGDDGPPLLAQMTYPMNVASSSKGILFINDSQNNRIRKVGPGQPACDTDYWTGAVSTAWEEPGNWSCDIVPGAATNVVINSGTVVLHSNVTVWTLSIASGVSFTVTSPYNLVILH